MNEQEINELLQRIAILENVNAEMMDNFAHTEDIINCADDFIPESLSIKGAGNETVSTRFEQTLEQTRQALAQHKQVLAQSKQTLTRSNQALVQSKQILVQAQQTLAQPNQDLAQTRQAMAQAHKALMQLTQSLEQSQQDYAQYKQDSAQFTQALVQTVEEQKNGVSELKEKAENHLAHSEYGKAVALIEENEWFCSDPSFNKIKDRLLIHYTQVAKSYFSKTDEFITRQQIKGKDGRALFDEKGRLPANALSENLTDEEKAVLDRVDISRKGYADYSVSIEIFGTRAVFPGEDIILDPVTPPAGGYTDPALLLEEAEKNTALYRYAAAVRLLEENPQLSADPSFGAVKNRLAEYYTKNAKAVYNVALSYAAWQEAQGNPLAGSWEGYDKKSRALDPAYFLTEAEKSFFNRVKVICTDEKIPEFKVTIDFCGMTAVYPANDVGI